MWFSILVRRWLKCASFTSVENLKQRILDFIDYFNKTFFSQILFSTRFNGVGIRMVRRLLGHRNLQTTERYAELADETMWQELGLLPGRKEGQYDQAIHTLKKKEHLREITGVFFFESHTQSTWFNVLSRKIIHRATNDF